MNATNPLHSHLLEQAHANRWINAEWWKALNRLSVAEMDRQQGAFFGSIWGTWNHLLLADRIWLSRLLGRPFTFHTLSDRLCHSKAEFEYERSVTDGEWIEAVAADPDPQRVLVYRNSSGAEFRTPLCRVLQHLFMHQAHHRGQIHQMCDERGIALPDGGLIGYYRAHSPLPMPPRDVGVELRALLLEQARANQWINQEWWKALRGLSMADLDRPQGAFFGSIFGTWNHILLGDRIWLGRITGRLVMFNELSDRLCSTVEQFLEERARTDQALIDQAAAEPDLTRMLEYQDNRGQACRTPLRQVFQHLFAHQAHHRGQIHQMCDERGIALPDGGLIGYYRSH
jgi:uncharacterized damage-inducible protein DinB